MRTRRNPLHVLAASVYGAFQICAAAEDWTNWRGPRQTLSTTNGSYPKELTEQSIAWKRKLPGKGTSIPIVIREKIFLTSPSAGEDAVLAFDMAGRELWQTKLGPEDRPKHRTLASSGNASPVTDGQSLFVYFKSGHFASLDLDGKVRWKTNLVEQFGRDQLFWDQGASPVLVGEHIIMARMHGGPSWIAAFDKATGALAWKADRNYKVPTENDNGYSTPLVFEHHGRPALLAWGADHLTAHSASNGKLLWSVDGFNPQGTGYWPAIATPVIVGEVAVIPVGRDDRGQAEIHGVSLGASADATARRIWKRDDTGVFVASPSAALGKVFLLRHRGEIVCLDPKTGNTLWTGALPEHRTPYYASPVVANGILYAAREDGRLFSAAVSEKFQLLGDLPLNERIVATPVPSNNRLLVRGDDHLFCLVETASR